MVIDTLVFVLVTGEVGGAVAGPPPVSYTPVIGVATMLGWGYRRLTQGAAQGRDAPAGGADE